MRQGPAEVDLGFDKLAVSDRQYFRIAKSLAPWSTAFVGHKHAVAVLDAVDEREVGNVFTIGPAAREVGLAVDTIVERAGEVKVLSDERFDDRAILSTYAWYAFLATETGSNDEVETSAELGISASRKLLSRCG